MDSKVTLWLAIILVIVLLVCIIVILTMGNQLVALVKYVRHILFHCLCCKYCKVCNQCLCRSKCEHSIPLCSSDPDIEAGEEASLFGTSNGRSRRDIENGILEAKVGEIETKLEEANALIMHKDTEILDLKRKVDDLTHRLSAEMSSKVSANESAVENVNIKNRPMNVAEDYQLLCSNEWLGAKTALDDIVNEQKALDDTVDEIRQDVPEYIKVTLLREIIVVTDMKIKEEFEIIQSKVNSMLQMLCQPLGHKKQEHVLIEDLTPVKTTTNTLGITNNIGDLMRIQADTIDYQHVVQAIYETTGGHLTECNLSECLPLWNLTKYSSDVKIFIQKMANIRWKMIVQRPPMDFEFTTEYKGEKYQDLQWSSKNVPGAVAFEVYPILYHDKSLMAKGKTLLVDPRDVIITR